MSGESSGPSGTASSSRKSDKRYHHLLSVSPDKWDLVIGTGCKNINEIKKASGANLYVVDSSTPGYGPREIDISGTLIQIRQAIRLIYGTTGGEKIVKKEAQEFWKIWVSHAYPDFQSRAYFLPPVFINRVPRVKSRFTGQELNVLETSQLRRPPYSESLRESQSRFLEDFGTPGEVSQPPRVQDSDVAKDAALERVLMCLHKMAEVHNETFMALSQLQFGDYLGEITYANACALMPTVANLSSTLSRSYRQGTFDLLLIHKLYGLILCEVKAISGKASGQEIGKRLRMAVSQLDKAQVVLKHLLSDIAPGIRVTKVIALPNLTETQINTALGTDLDLTKLLSRCLGTTDSDVINGLICSTYSHPTEDPWDVDEHLLHQLRKWWQLHVACLGRNLLMTAEVYENIVARFCGPATTVTVPCTTSPRMSVKTLGQGVSKTGVYFAQLTLFPEQVNLIDSEPSRVFLAGPPGTGKTVVLLLVALKWLWRNHDVYVMSTTEHSRLVSCMLHHLLHQAQEMMRQSGKEECGRVHLLQYNFRGGADVGWATQELKNAAKNGKLYIIADEVGPDDLELEKNFPAVGKTHFNSFCENLIKHVRHTRLWAASCKHGVVPKGWNLECLTKPLRSPPAVLKEVEMSEELGSLVHLYSSRGVPYPTQGPEVKQICHGSPAHSSFHPVDCQECGKEVAIFLKELKVGDQDNQVAGYHRCFGLCAAAASAAAAGETTYRRLSDVIYPPTLQFRDVLVLCVGHVDNSSGVVQGLRSAGIPAKVMESKEDMEDVATARSDVVWVSFGNVVRGIERKVVVCVRDEYPKADRYNRLYPLSRCMSQLVLVVPIPPHL